MRRRILKGIILIGLILLLLLGGTALLFSYLISLEKVKGLATAKLGEHLHRKVTIGEIRFGIFRGIELSHLSIANPPEFSPQEFVFSEKLILKVRLLPLLRRRLVLNKVEILRPKIFIERDRNGLFNCSDLLGTSSLALLVSELKIIEGEVTFKDWYVVPPAEITIHGFKIDLFGLSPSAVLKYEAKGILSPNSPFKITGTLSPLEKNIDLDLELKNLKLTLFNSYSGSNLPFNFSSGGLEATIYLKVREEDLIESSGRVNLAHLNFTKASLMEPLNFSFVYRIKGSLQGKYFKFSKLTSQLKGTPLDLEGEFRLIQRNLEVNNLRLAAYGGSLEGYLRMDLGDSQPQYKFKGKIANMQLNDILSSLTSYKDRVYGDLSGEFSLQGRGMELQYLRGEGWFQLLKGRLLKLNFIEELKFGEMGGHFKIAKGVVETSDLKLTSSNLNGLAKGRASFDSKLDFDLVLFLSPELSKELSKKAKIASFLEDREGRVTLELKVEGTLNNPRIRPNPTQVQRIIEERIPLKLDKKTLETLEKLFKR